MTVRKRWREVTGSKSEKTHCQGRVNMRPVPGAGGVLHIDEDVNGTGNCVAIAMHGKKLPRGTKREKASNHFSSKTEKKE